MSDDGLGREAADKTRTKLNALVIRPRPELAQFAASASKIFDMDDSEAVLALAWGMAIATYPFFGMLTEITGRLTALQGDCSTAALHRRMGEIFGEREIVTRATQAVIQTQIEWGALERTEDGRGVRQRPPLPVRRQGETVWLMEAGMRHAGKAHRPAREQG